MEGILKYDLNDFDDKMSHLRAVKSLDLTLFAWDMSNLCKNLEYTLESMYDSGKEFTASDMLDLVRSSIIQKMEEHCIDLSDLIV
jgi:hypothetical protein